VLIKNAKDIFKEMENRTPRAVQVDTWEKRGNVWIRYHDLLRTEFYWPETGPGGPILQHLLPVRMTKAIQNDGDDNKTQVIEDRLDFTRPPLDEQHLDTPWTGITVFFEKDQDFMYDNDDDNIDEHDEEHDDTHNLQRTTRTSCIRKSDLQKQR
jgi:hypothetical protein